MDKDYKKLLIIFCVYGILFIGFFIFKNTKYDISKDISNNHLVNSDYSQEELEDNPSSEIYVHIGGQVNYPGLIVLNNGSRLYEAIEIAGGLTENADVDQVNLAQVLNDQDKIIIPQKGEPIPGESTTGDGNTLININTASKEELMKLSGIGEKTADNIIEYRKENKFNTIEDIMEVPGIGQGKFEQIEKQITK